jgi:hypothetical protein
VRFSFSLIGWTNIDIPRVAEHQISHRLPARCWKFSKLQNRQLVSTLIKTGAVSLNYAGPQSLSDFDPRCPSLVVKRELTLIWTIGRYQISINLRPDNHSPGLFFAFSNLYALRHATSSKIQAIPRRIDLLNSRAVDSGSVVRAATILRNTAATVTSLATLISALPPKHYGYCAGGRITSHFIVSVLYLGALL